MAVDLAHPAPADADYHRVNNIMQRVLSELELLANEADLRRVRRPELTTIVELVVDATDALHELRRAAGGPAPWPSGGSGR